MKKYLIVLALLLASPFLAMAATTVLPIFGGGTGTGSAPSYGNILVGNSSGGYTLTATTSLNVLGTYGDTNVNSYINSSTTIPKTYTDNTFTGNQTFPNTITTPGGTMTFPNTPATVVPFSIDSATPLNSVYRLRFSDWNFIANASFESWLSGTSVAPDAWNIQGTATVARDGTAYQGTYSADVTYGAASDGEFYSLFGVNTNVDYTYSAYVTRVSGTGNARLVAQQNFGSYTEDASVGLSTSAGQQLITLTFKPSLSGNYRINFKATDSAGSVWRIDEVKAQESKGVSTAWTPSYLNDSFNQTIYGTPTFSNGVTIGSLNGVLNTTAGSVSTIATSTFYTFGAGLSAGNTLQQIEHPSFQYATSTAWTGTTTVFLQIGYGEVFNSVQCATDVGTVGVDFYHASSHLDYIPTASTTANVNAFTTNNTITASDLVKVDIGNPVSLPTKVLCTIKDTI